ncbi:MAG TPA: Holliday junction resolvase RuvX [Microscillaceae bacterium]|jgi:putative Holliday junction resolvase|nr:Holliday junction resolvase RuvX [Microscillaceae bacterium]
MGRIVAIDYGTKRTGLAVTDPLQIIATALETVPTHTLFTYLQQYIAQEPVELFVLGLPIDLQGQDTETTQTIRRVGNQLQQTFPDIPLSLQDERFTSKSALAAMISAGSKKKDRQNKANIDKVSAVIILQSYLETQSS